MSDAVTAGSGDGDGGVCVGFIGLGQIGAPMAEHLIGWPGGLWVFDVVAEACAPFAAKGAHVASDVAELGKHCGVIEVMVRDDAQVRDVTRELLGTVAAGTVIAIHSTIAAGTAAELAAEAAPQGVHVVDAPVSGGFLGAYKGNLAVMLGGEDAAIEICREPFATWAGLVVHCGSAGGGTRAKLARNLLSFASFAVVGEAQRLAEAAGIDLGDLAKVVRHSDAITGGVGTIMLRDTTAPMADDNPLRQIMTHTATLGAKDLSQALDLADSLGVDLPIARIAVSSLAGALGVPDALD